ncbi:MAG: hypothetical protein HDS68_01240 [Bacteroidales bacterium]|nr:hypothetical protein [Bacteroidales bacterium]
MKKAFKLISMAFIALTVSAGFVACSSDDDDQPESGSGINQELATPTYEADAALYNITSANSDYRSIELTAAGNYVVVMDYGYYGAPARKAGVFRKSAIVSSRAYNNGIIEGTFTKTGDNTYNLKGFGTITVTGNGGTAVDLDITLEDGTDVNVTAARKNQKPDSMMTNNLCRTWEFERLRYTIKINNRVMFDKEVDVNNMRELYLALANAGALDDDEEIDWDDFEEEMEYMAERVIFTKAGTYLVEYRNSSLAISTWSWINENAGTLRYSWDYDDMEDDDYAGNVVVSFPGNNRMKIAESYYDYDDEDGESYNETITWTLKQA